MQPTSHVSSVKFSVIMYKIVCLGREAPPALFSLIRGFSNNDIYFQIGTVCPIPKQSKIYKTRLSTLFVIT